MLKMMNSNPVMLTPSLLTNTPISDNYPDLLSQHVRKTYTCKTELSDSVNFFSPNQLSRLMFLWEILHPLLLLLPPLPLIPELVHQLWVEMSRPLQPPSSDGTHEAAASPPELKWCHLDRARPRREWREALRGVTTTNPALRLLMMYPPERDRY